jgi:hypothetical protein
MNYIGFSISIFRIKNNNRLLICKCRNADGSVLHKKVLVVRCAVLHSIVSIACAFQAYLPRGVENAFVVSPS